jgi:uncharacterized cupredoxin-like copper-binding protein
MNHGKHAAMVCAAAMLFIAAQHARADETIHVMLTDNEIRLDNNEAKTGRITFDVNNAAKDKTEHEFVILKTDKDAAHLPVRKGQVPENDFRKMGEVEDIAQGASKRLSLKLAPGRYVLICNRPGHYAMGMHTSFVVAR